MRRVIWEENIEVSWKTLMDSLQRNRNWQLLYSDKFARCKEPKEMKKKIRSASLCDFSSLRISFYKDNNDKLFRTLKLNVAKSCDAKLP